MLYDEYENKIKSVKFPNIKGNSGLSSATTL